MKCRLGDKDHQDKASVGLIKAIKLKKGIRNDNIYNNTTKIKREYNYVSKKDQAVRTSKRIIAIVEPKQNGLRSSLCVKAT